MFIFKVHDGESDVVIVTIKNQQKAREYQLIPVAHELSNDHYYVVVSKDLNNDLLAKTPMYVSNIFSPLISLSN